MKLDLGKLGIASGEIPSSLAICWDFFTEYRSATEAQKNHLNAAAIGAANQTRLLPRYPYAKGNPVEYGFGIYDLLLTKAGLSPLDITQLGDPILAEMFRRAHGVIQSEVTEKENFSSPKEGG